MINGLALFCRTPLPYLLPCRAAPPTPRRVVVRQRQRPTCPTLPRPTFPSAATRPPDVQSIPSACAPMADHHVRRPNPERTATVSRNDTTRAPTNPNTESHGAHRGRRPLPPRLERPIVAQWRIVAGFSYPPHVCARVMWGTGKSATMRHCVTCPTVLRPPVRGR
jgi:hypothetical protein